MKVNRKIIIFFFLWFASIVLFDLILFLKKDSQKSTSIELLFMLLTVGFGIISFIVFILSLENFFHKKYPKVKASIFSSLSFIGFVIFGLGLIVLPFVLFNKPQEIVKPTQASKNTLISSPLKLGSLGEQVKIIQSALSTDKSIYPSGIVSGYYGELTKQAVINFQQKYNLHQTGEVDQQTIDKFNEIYGDKTKEYYLSKSLNNQTNNTIINNINTSYVDPDHLVKCHFSQNCSGETKIIKRSICNQLTCCEIGNKFYLLYINDCKYYQQEYNKILEARLKILKDKINLIKIPTLQPFNIKNNLSTFPTIPPIRVNTPSFDIRNYNEPVYINKTQLYEECINNAKSEYQSIINSLSTNGALESSIAEEAKTKKDRKINECQSLYGE